MAKTKLTAGRIEQFKVEPGKAQAFLWDSDSPGLGLRTTASGAKSYIFQAKLGQQTIRVTIGDPRSWDIPDARAEARKLKVLVDSGLDPRKLKADELAAKEATLLAERANQAREAVTLADVWPEYIADRIATREGGWSESHIEAHRAMMQAGGETRKRSPKLTQPGPLFSLSNVRLVDLTSECIEAWAKVEAKARPSSARLALRLLKACMNWCGSHKTYGSIVPTNPTRSARARETLGRPKTRNDVLQREMLAPWYASVGKINNPVISAYLQILLLIGARREELAALKWKDVNFQWGSIRLKDKIEGSRMVPLTPYVAHLMSSLPRRNEYVFSSVGAEAGYIAEPRHAHNDAVEVAGLPPLTLHGLRRSFASLSEWVEMPAGIAAQIQGHAPQGVREQNYIRRPLDLLRLWHTKIESWMLEQAGVDFVPTPTALRAVTA